MEKSLTTLSFLWLLDGLLAVFPPEQVEQNKQQIGLMFLALKEGFGQAEVTPQWIESFFGTIALINKAGGFQTMFEVLTILEKNGYLKEIGKVEIIEKPLLPI